MTSLPENILNGLHVIVTSGPTREAIDPVRYLSNHSSGKQGHAVASVFAALGARVTLISGPVAIAPPKNMDVVHVVSAQDMLKATINALPADVAVCVAAVADWRPEIVAPHKMKKRDGGDAPIIKLTQNPDILKTLGHHAARPRVVAGFAAETENVVDGARKKLHTKNADVIFVNDIIQNAFGSDDNHIQAVLPDQLIDFGPLNKTDTAKKIVALITELLKGQTS